MGPDNGSSAPSKSWAWHRIGRRHPIPLLQSRTEAVGSNTVTAFLVDRKGTLADRTENTLNVRAKLHDKVVKSLLGRVVNRRPTVVTRRPTLNYSMRVQQEGIIQADDESTAEVVIRRVD